MLRKFTHPHISFLFQTDKTGCGEKPIDLTEYALSDSRYEPSIVVQSEVEEDGTGERLVYLLKLVLKYCYEG